MAINTETRKRIAFSLIMGVITTGVITCTLIAVNFGFNSQFLYVWIKSWLIAYIVVIPIILIVSPFLQAAINSYYDSSE